MKDHGLAEIVNVLKGAAELALISHYNPDSDAYGAICALGLALEQHGAVIHLLGQEGALRRYLFIPGVARIKDVPPAPFPRLAVVCDCGDLRRVGKSFQAAVEQAPCIINIDHHISNEYFGHYNLVREGVSSTCEIIYDLLEAAKLEITPQIATGLLAGIMGDSGSFRYASVTAETFNVAAELVRCGAKPEEVADGLYSNNTLAAVRLHAEALAGLRMHFEGRVCEVLVDEAMFKRSGAQPDDTDLLVEKARDIQGVQVAFLVQAWEGIWRVSLRSRGEAQNVAEVARSFKGGGHKNAAGFRWGRELEELRARLLEEIRKIL